MKRLILIFIFHFLFLSEALGVSLKCEVKTSNWCHYNEKCTGITSEQHTWTIDEFMASRCDRGECEHFGINYYTNHPIYNYVTFRNSLGYIIIEKSTGKFVHVSGGPPNLSTVHRYGFCKIN